MSSDESRRHGRACGGDVAAYALGSLDPAEAEAFRTHLETCTVCRDDLAAFQEVVDTLALTVPARRPSAQLRRRVMAAVAADAAPAQARGGAGVGGPAGRRPDRARRRRIGGWLPRPALGAAAGLAVAVIAALAIVLGSGSSPGARVIQASVTGAGTAQLRLASDRGELILHHFSPPPAGEIYEVWTKRGSQAPQPTTALFSVTSSGDGDVTVPGSLRHVSTVMVTPEPDGGTSHPTHPAVLEISLT